MACHGRSAPTTGRPLRLWAPADCRAWPSGGSAWGFTRSALPPAIPSRTRSMSACTARSRRRPPSRRSGRAERSSARSIAFGRSTMTSGRTRRWASSPPRPSISRRPAPSRSACPSSPIPLRMWSAAPCPMARSAGAGAGCTSITRWPANASASRKSPMATGGCALALSSTVGSTRLVPTDSIGPPPPQICHPSARSKVLPISPTAEGEGGVVSRIAGLRRFDGVGGEERIDARVVVAEQVREDLARMLAHAIRSGPLRMHGLSVEVIGAGGDPNAAPRAMRQGGEESPLGQMGRGDDLGGVEHGGTGDARLVEDLESGLDALEPVQPLPDQLLQRAPVRAAPIPGGEARILGQVRALHHREEPRPEVGGAHALQGEIAAAQLVNEHARAGIAVLAAAIQHGREGDAVRGHERLEHRDIEAGALPRARAAKERAQDGGGRVGGGQHVGGLEVRGPRIRLVSLLEVHESGDGVGDVREGGAEPPRAALAESRDRAIDDAGLDLTDDRVVAAEAGGHARREVLDENIGVAGDIDDHATPLGG